MAALSVAMVARAVVVWSDLPPVMASHFDAQGVPNGFQSRGAFMSIIFGVQAVMIVAFGVVAALLHRIPPSLINLPYREYWLTGDRMHEAIERTATWTAWFGCGTSALIFGVFELALQANLTRTPLDSTLMWLLLGGFFVGAGVGVVRLFASLKPPHDGQPTRP
jgi:uncharacterized membrane-anchored protein YitT (DUF2179 family)